MGKLIKLIRVLSIKQVAIGVAVIGAVSGGTYATYNVVQANKAKNVAVVETTKTGHEAAPEVNKTDPVSSDSAVKTDDNSNETATEATNSTNTDSTTQQPAAKTNSSTTQSNNKTQTTTSNSTSKQNTTSNTNTKNTTQTTTQTKPTQTTPPPTTTTTKPTTPVRASGIDQAMTDKLNEKEQLVENFDSVYGRAGKTADLIQSAKNIALGKPVLDSIKTPWEGVPGDPASTFCYKAYAVRVVTGEDTYYYTRFPAWKDGIGGFSYVVAYWDSSINGYKFYYIRITLN